MIHSFSTLCTEHNRDEIVGCILHGGGYVLSFFFELVHVYLSPKPPI